MIILCVEFICFFLFQLQAIVNTASRLEGLGATVAGIGAQSHFNSPPNMQALLVLITLQYRPKPTFTRHYDITTNLIDS